MVVVGVLCVGGACSLPVMEVDCSGVVFFMIEGDIFEWRFCGGGGGGGSGGSKFQNGNGMCCEAGFVVFEWEGVFLVTFESDVGGSKYV